MHDAIKAYVKTLAKALETGITTEHSHRATLQKLIEALDSKLQVINEATRIAVGSPDLVIRKPITKGEYLPLGYIETKDVGVKLDEIEKTDQLQRYKRLSNLILTDYLEFRWFVDSKHRMTVTLATYKKGKLKIEADGEEKLLNLLETFLDHAVEDINSPKELAAKMAGYCNNIDGMIAQSFADGTASELMQDLKSAFERTLLPDITPEQFSDMFAQTLGYGLFAARIQHAAAPAAGAPKHEFTRTGAAREIPKSNPFLRNLFDTMHSADLEEEPFIGFVDDLTAVLAHSDIEAILASFGKRTKQEDPILHFYETFLSEYDPKERKRRGVYYTPEPVVSYIVRSVDILLKEKFGLKDGLADTSTIEVEVKEGDKFVKRKLPKVLILDPACGTGTFLYAVVDLIRQRFMDRNDAGSWQAFVKEHLIPRIYGFELQMAPYAVAHLKLAMQLAGHDLDPKLRAKWGYEIEKDQRLHVYLTNSLEYTEEKIQMEFGFIERAIADEARAAQAIKGELPIMVVMGNPPYSMFGKMNEGKWILGLEADYKIGSAFKKWNRDDYIKFIRFGQWRIDRSKQGILAFITNNGYFTDKTRNGMRKSLLSSFDKISILNLHGSVKRGKLAKSLHNDQNVFDIEQGVGIGIFAKLGSSNSGVIEFEEVFGDRQAKYRYLLDNDLTTTSWNKLKIAPPSFLFKLGDLTNEPEYKAGFDISNAFGIVGPGIKTERDSISLHMTSEDIHSVVADFRTLAESELALKYVTEDSRDWKVSNAKEDVKQSKSDSCYRRIIYRPFDARYTWYSGKTRGFIGTPNFPVMRHMISGSNLFIGTVNNVETDGGWCHVFCSNILAQHHSVSMKEGNQFFPLYLYPADGSARKPNLDAKFVAEFAGKLGLTFVEEGGKWIGAIAGLETHNGGKSAAAKKVVGKAGQVKTPAAALKGAARISEFGPEDIFYYIYAVFHSPTYRERYKEFLKIDFPRVPLTSNLELFSKLVPLGYELVQYHLLEYPNLDKAPVVFPEKGDNTVVKVDYNDHLQRVYINKTQWFEPVAPEVWEFHVGGYQVCNKWLKDRKGRTLSFDEIRHYAKTVMALGETIRLMKEIDAAIPEWPIQ